LSDSGTAPVGAVLCEFLRGEATAVRPVALSTGELSAGELSAEELGEAATLGPFADRMQRGDPALI
jgi:hypothetical protein